MPAGERMPSNRENKSGSDRKGGRVTYLARDAKTGRYVVQRPAQNGADGQGATPKKERPDTFIEEFTKHPVVDRVMKRLSR